MRLVSKFTNMLACLVLYAEQLCFSQTYTQMQLDVQFNRNLFYIYYSITVSNFKLFGSLFSSVFKIRGQYTCC